MAYRKTKKSKKERSYRGEKIASKMEIGEDKQFITILCKKFLF